MKKGEDTSQEGYDEESDNSSGDEYGLDQDEEDINI